MPAYCPIHQHYKWCQHNGGIPGPSGYAAPERQPMATLKGKEREAALAAWEGRRALHGRDRGTPRFIDNTALPAGSPMVFTCLACFGWVILAEDYLTPQAICYDCRDLADAGWIVAKPDGEWVRT